MHCPNCSKRKYIKNGFIGACQRYKCKKCGHNFTKGTKHGYSEKDKMDALVLYMHGLGCREIGRRMNISHATIINWLNKVSFNMRKTMTNTRFPFGNLYPLHKYIKENNICLDGNIWIKKIPFEWWTLMKLLLK